MNRENKLPKPEMPQGGPMPEIMMAIMPDFPKWNRLFFQLDCTLVFVYILLECIFVVFFWQEELMEDSLGMYAFRHLILPSVISMTILLVAAVLRKR